MRTPEEDGEALASALDKFLDPRGRADIKFGLDRIKTALAELGDPQEWIPQAIHIAGTNGKGSVASYLRFMAHECDLLPHVFTSPHLIKVNERIRLAGRLVEDHELTAALERVHLAGPDLTYFEALTAAAFLLFVELEADLCIIETGAGGELDSTNVMSAPAACVITHISMDHERMFNARSLEDIARVKAGIMRRGVPVIISEQEPGPRDTLLQAADEIGAPAILMGRDFHARWDDGAFVYEDDNGPLRTPWLGLAGDHQRANAAVACAALRKQNWSAVSPECMEAGLRETRWPGRMETLIDGPLTRGLNARIIVDGAHNPAAARMLANEMQRVTHEEGRAPAVVFAVQGAKDAIAILTHIAPHSGFLVTCPLPLAGQEGGSSADPHALSLMVEDLGVHTAAVGSIENAFKLIAASGAQTIFVCGSLYLAGAVLKLNDQTVS